MPISTISRQTQPTQFVRRWLAASLCVAALAVALLPGSAGSEHQPYAPALAAPGGSDEEARVIVKYRADAPMAQALAIAQGGRQRPQHAIVLGQRLRLNLADGRVLGPRTQSLRGTGLSSARLADKLSAMADVEWAVPDQRRTRSALPNDPLLADGQTTVTPVAGQWHLRAPTQTIVAAINATGAWNTTEGSASITVATLDSGVLFLMLLPPHWAQGPFWSGLTGSTPSAAAVFSATGFSAAVRGADFSAGSFSVLVSSGVAAFLAPAFFTGLAGAPPVVSDAPEGAFSAMGEGAEGG